MNLQCPAKVNLFLEVTGKRRDGYHNLATVFAKINLFDTLKFSPVLDGRVELVIDNKTPLPLSAGPDNLVVRAAEAFRKEFKEKLGVRIDLEKKIPFGAGLGGGSSDAAGTLLGLVRFYGTPANRTTTARLKKLGRALGADVPFFLQDAPYALGEGIGDELKPIKVAKAPPPMVLVYPRMTVSTKDAYGRLVRPGKSATLTSLSQLRKLQKKLGFGRPISEWADLLFNRLEEPVLPAFGQVRQAKELLARTGALGTLMSGSGSSVFGFFLTQAEAEKAASRLRAYPWEVFTTCCMG